MSEPADTRLSPLSRLSVLLALVALSAATLGISVFLAFIVPARVLGTSQVQALQMVNLAVSAVALVLASIVAWHLFRQRRTESVITVCAWTRRVQWRGRWLTFEEYLALRFNQRCTHGICAEAADQLREEQARTVPDARAVRAASTT